MIHHRAGSATLIAIILLAGVVFAVANVAVMLMAVHDTHALPSFAEFYSFCPSCTLYFVAAPLIVSMLVALMVSQRPTARPPAPPEAVEAPPEAAPAAPPVAAPAAPAPPTGALRLLALLQHEGRFLDFVLEDIDAYSDGQVGAAVRSIHAGCRKALHDGVELERILTAEEGTEVVVEAGFDPSSVRVTGNVAGEPPFRGILQHGGWRATKITLPPAPGGADPSVVAPAEVEIS